MPSSSHSQTEPSDINMSKIAGFDYPEMYVIICAVILINVQYNYNATSLALFSITVLPCLIIIWLSYRRIHNAAIDFACIALMGILSGSMQFCLPILTSMILLGGVRFIRTNPEYRITMVILMALTMGVFYFISKTVFTGIVECHTVYAYLVTGLAVLCVLWQFWSIYNQAITFYEQSQKSKQRVITLISVINKLTRFIPPQVWKPIIKTDGVVEACNKRAKLTVMFSDIAGFTSLSDELSSDNLAEILNTYMQSMTQIANRHGAVLDKFIGDGMVCFFGEPTSKGVRNDALACVAMAIDMRREMRTLRHQWRLQGFGGLYIRIGITTGYCHVGNFGSRNRLSYTLIGREANLASRLESAANKGAILISQETYNYICHDYKCISEGALELKGFDKPVSTYRVLDPSDEGNTESKWVDYDLPGFNLHLNFKDIKNYDYRTIKTHLNQALERIEKENNENLDK